MQDEKILTNFMKLEIATWVRERYEIHDSHFREAMWTILPPPEGGSYHTFLFTVQVVDCGYVTFTFDVLLQEKVFQFVESDL